MKTTLLSLITALLLGATSLVSAQEIVDIPDPELQAVIREALNKPTGDITAAEMETLTELDASTFNRGFDDTVPILSLEGLEFANNLEVLNLSGHPGAAAGWDAAISLVDGDLSALVPLTRLQSIDVSFNQLTEFRFPASFGSLAHLNIQGNPITDSAILGGLTNLITLTGGSSTGMDSFVVPNSLVRLENLSLRRRCCGFNPSSSSGALKNIALPDNLPNLKVVDIRDNQVNSLEIPSGFIAVEVLLLGKNTITNLMLPDSMENLRILDLEENSLENIEFPSGMSALTNLNIKRNPIGELIIPDSATNMITLEFLIDSSISENVLTNLYLPNGMSELQTLDLSYHQIETLALPGGMSNLVTLKAPGIRLRNLSFADDPIGLKHLNLAENNLEDFTFLRSLTSLEHLQLELGAGPTDIGLFTSLTNLSYLNIDGGALNDFSWLSQMPKMTELLLYVHGASHVVIPEGLTNLSRLSIYDSTMSRLNLPSDLGSLQGLTIQSSQLGSLSLPTGMTNLVYVNFPVNLVELSLPDDLSSLEHIELSHSSLRTLVLPKGLVALEHLDVSQNNLSTLTLPEDIADLRFLDVRDNPLSELRVPAWWDPGRLELLGYPKEDITFYDPEPEPFEGIELEIVGSYDTEGSAQAVAVSGNYAYVTTSGITDEGRQLVIFDIGTPSIPDALGTYNFGGQPQSLIVMDQYVYVVEAQKVVEEFYDEWNLIVINIADPENPLRIGSLQISETWDMTLSGDNIYLAQPRNTDVTTQLRVGTGGMEVIDISNPSIPHSLGSLRNGGDARAVKVRENLVYLASDDTDLQIIDVDDPVNPEIVAEINGFETAYDIALLGHLAYVAAYQQGLTIIDISDPSTPLPLLTSEPSVRQHTDVKISGSYAYVGNGEFGLIVYDISNPTNPMYIGGNSTFYPADIALFEESLTSPAIVASGVGATADGYSSSGDYVYVAAGEDGLIILEKYRELRIGVASITENGGVTFLLSGARGQRVLVQRSTNLVDWEDWDTMTLTEEPCEITDNTTSATQLFYRVIPDDSNAQ